MRQAKKYKHMFSRLFILSALLAISILVLTPDAVSAGKVCGAGQQAAKVAIDFGCQGRGNPITDAAFAIIRFISLGVGLIIVGSLTYAGIQYTMSRGDPKATAEAIGRVRSNIVAFVIYLFAFAILNYVIPKGFIGL